MEDEIWLSVREELLESDEVREMISMRAYEIFENRGREPGHEASDWLQAESEIIALLIEEQRRLADAQARTVASAADSAPVQQLAQSTDSHPDKPAKKKSATREKKSKSEDGKKALKKRASKSQSAKSAADLKKKKK